MQVPWRLQFTHASCKEMIWTANEILFRMLISSRGYSGWRSMCCFLQLGWAVQALLFHLHSLVWMPSFAIALCGRRFHFPCGAYRYAFLAHDVPALGCVAGRWGASPLCTHLLSYRIAWMCFFLRILWKFYTNQLQPSFVEADSSMQSRAQRETQYTKNDQRSWIK